MSKAYCLIRTQPHYRHDAFVQGFKRCGYDVELSYARWPVRQGDVLLIWNRYGDTEQIADRFEADGGTVLVAENGYIGPGGGTPKLADGPGNHYYALARHAHNGRGQWFSGGMERWDALGVDLQPWRKDGEHILVCANRSFGMKGGVMPHEWALELCGRLKQVTKRPIRVRHHPGNFASKVPLAEDLKNAWACVIWSSSCGVHALIAGVPVVCEAPWWICKGAAFPGVGAYSANECGRGAEHLLQANREYALRRLAWAQWSVEEIANGEAFGYLLSDTRQAQSAAAV